MKKFFRILFFVFASFFAVACSSSSSDETETNISEQSDSDGENSEHKSEDASGAADVKFENQSFYSVSVYLSNPKYNSNLAVFAEVEAASSAEKKYTGDIDSATTFYFVYNLNNLGSAAYPYIPYDTISDHKTQKLSKDEQTTVIIDDIEDFKTDSAFLILQNDTTSSVYLVSGNSPLNPYGMNEKEIQYGKSAFYEIGGSGKGAIPFEKASELRAVINSSEYRELPKINYEAGKVYTVTVSKTAVERTNTTFFPSSGSVYEVVFANPKNPLQNRVASFEEGTELSADDLAALSVDGYDFLGWYIGDKKIEEGFKIKQNYTLSAKLEAIEYTINYELNGGKNSAENPQSYTIESDSFSFAAPTRTGYKFSGWYETEDFAGSSTAGIESGSFGDKTLYAKWEAVSYTISYVLNGGENSSENRSEYTIESDSITLASPSKTGATFLGWYETENFSGSKITSIPKGSVGNKSFYAKWNFITYSISYELNGGTNAAGNPTSYTTNSGTVAILNPTRSGYSFAGWYKASDFSGNSVSEIESGSFGNITLYAKWDSTFTAERIADLDLSKISGAYTLKVAGDITSDTILELASKIENSSANITLDLSEATGLTEIKRFGSNGTFDSDFVNCKTLKSVILPNCLETLGDDTFYGCKSLVSVTLPSSLTTIGNSVLMGCKNLKEITIPNSVTSLGYMTFYRCESLESVTIPASVTKIGSGSFQYCEKLQSITFADTTTWYYGDVSYKNGTQISVYSPTRNARYFTSTYVDKYWYKE
nr:InlB B-repeat-containing protein [Treponema sp.]